MHPVTKTQLLPEEMSMPRSLRSRSQSGFSLLEMLVAITITMIIMGSVYGLMTQSQSSFAREPMLADRQQQARIALDRIQDDLLLAGESMSTPRAGIPQATQSFATGLNNLGIQGVRAAGDTQFGGANADYLEIRTLARDCPTVRFDTVTPMVGSLLNTIEAFPSCFPEPGWVLLMFTDGRSKFGWLDKQRSNGNDASLFPVTQPDGSQIASPSSTHVNCSVWIGTTGGLTSPNGSTCPAGDDLNSSCPACWPYAVAKVDMVRYELGIEDSVPGLYRSSTGGIAADGSVTHPPGSGWQLVARGVEDMQVQYRSVSSGNTWLDDPGLVASAAPDNIATQARVTLWVRTIAPAGTHYQGETTSPGNNVTALRAALSTTVAPRSAQVALSVINSWK